jgi:hypothetical protein
MPQDTAAPANTLDSILDQLEQFRQRATYGSVAKLLNRPPRNLMAGRDRDPHSSWIVSRDTGMPTGYSDEQMHPELTARETILSTPNELAAWLENPS